MHERISYILHGNNKLRFTFIYSKISDRCRVWSVARSQVIWFNFVLPACHEIFTASPWERSGSDLLQLNYLVFSLRTSTIKSNKASVWLVCHCECDVWSTSHSLSPSLSLSLWASPLWFPSLSTLLSNEAEIPLKSWILEAYVKFSFSSHHTLSLFIRHVKRLPPISRKSQHPPALTSINQTACKRVLMIYASGWAPCSHGKLCLDNSPRGMIISEALAPLIWLPH